MLKRILFCQLTFILSLTAYGQNKLSIEDFINNKIEQSIDNNSLINDEKFPWINEYELRTETRDFNFGKQEYTLRLSPNTSKVRTAQESIYRHLASLPDYEKQEIYCDIINESVEALISIYLTEELLKIYQAWEIVIADKQLILSKLSGSLDFDYNEILNLIELKTKVKYNKEKLAIENNGLRQQQNLAEASIDFNSLISIDNIKTIIETQEIKNAEIVLNTKNQYDLDLAKKELELEKAERKQYLDFVQLKYRGPHDDPLQERFSLGLGLRLPNSSNQKLKMKELELEQSNILKEVNADQKKSTRSTTDAKYNLELDLLYAEEYINLIAEENKALDDLTDQIKNDRPYDVLLLLEIKDRQIETRIQSINLIGDVYTEYLEYINETGLLCAPETNLISLISQQ